jgi:hypothetical protein
MDAQTIVILIFSGITALAILYAIIYFSVRSATSDLLKATRIQNILLTEYLKSKGVNTKIGQEVMEEMKNLKAQKYSGRISDAQLEEKMKDYPF